MSENTQTIHTEIASGHVLHAMLASLWRRKQLVLVIGVAALTLGLLALYLTHKRYTAEAYIRGELAVTDTVAKDDDSVSPGSMSLDVIRVIETESLLLQSHQVARRVVQDLGLERLKPVVGGSGWLSSVFGGDASASGDAVDSAATRLLRGLSVTSDPRAYLITVRYSAGDPELAAEIANSFVAELLRSIKLQQLLQQRSVALVGLSKQLGKFGERHPGVVAAKLRLETADQGLKAELGEAGEAILKGAGENVTPAIAAVSGPRPAFVLGLLLVAGLVAGASAALFLERGRWWRAFSYYYAHPFGGVSLNTHALQHPSLAALPAKAPASPRQRKSASSARTEARAATTSAVLDSST
jgi:uncharacterized protein involved in exopolysaccharide biosynthesis